LANFDQKEEPEGKIQLKRMKEKLQVANQPLEAKYEKTAMKTMLAAFKTVTQTTAARGKKLTQRPRNSCPFTTNSTIRSTT